MTESITKRIPIPALAIIIDLACSVLLEIGTDFQGHEHGDCEEYHSWASPQETKISQIK